jgi:ribonuclease R
VTSFGAFVEIEEPFVEGLIKLDSLGEPFVFDETRMRLSGRRTGKSLELGDRVTVEINNVSVLRRRIDFTLVAGGGNKGVPAKLEASPRHGIQHKKKAGREVERAQAHHVERGAARRHERAGGKLRLGVSHKKPRKK